MHGTNRVYAAHALSSCTRSVRAASLCGQIALPVHVPTLPPVRCNGTLACRTASSGMPLHLIAFPPDPTVCLHSQCTPPQDRMQVCRERGTRAAWREAGPSDRHTPGELTWQTSEHTGTEPPDNWTAPKKGYTGQRGKMADEQRVRCGRKECATQTKWQLRHKLTTKNSRRRLLLPNTM